MRWLSKRLDMPVRLYSLRSLGFELVGGRLLPDAAGPSAQLMYQNTEGQRVTLYLRRPEPGSNASFAFQREGELGMFYWAEEGYGCALVGKAAQGAPSGPGRVGVQAVRRRRGGRGRAPSTGPGAPAPAGTNPAS